MTDRLVCVVEIPRGSRNKYEWDEELGRIRLDRPLPPSAALPTDYGYLPDTASDDGEPLDVFVAVSEPTFPGCAVVVRPVGVLRLRFQSGPESKLVCVPCDDPAWEGAERLEDLPERLREEIAEFFVAYKRDEGKEATVEGWGDRDAALAAIAEARRRAGSTDAEM